MLPAPPLELSPALRKRRPLSAQSTPSVPKSAAVSSILLVVKTDVNVSADRERRTLSHSIRASRHNGGAPPRVERAVVDVVVDVSTRGEKPSSSFASDKLRPRSMIIDKTFSASTAGDEIRLSLMRLKRSLCDAFCVLQLLSVG